MILSLCSAWFKAIFSVKLHISLIHSSSRSRKEKNKEKGDPLSLSLSPIERLEKVQVKRTMEREREKKKKQTNLQVTGGYRKYVNCFSMSPTLSMPLYENNTRVYSIKNTRHKEGAR